MNIVDVITVDGLSKTYGSGPSAVRALDDVSLTVAPGEILAVVGPSGSGKSTLVRCLSLLERPDAGTVTLGDVELTALGDTELRTSRRKLGKVFQQANLLDNRTARANIEYPLELALWTKRSRRQRSDELLELVGLSGRGDRYPAQLSGGQQQRVGIARALAAYPDVLLCDEPTSALDPDTTDEILQLLRTLRDELHVTILLITHDRGVVRGVADRVVELRDGRVAASGTVADIAAQPGSPLLAEFVPGGSADGVLTVGGGAAQASRPFLGELTAHLGADVHLVAGGVFPVGGSPVVQARLGVDPAHLERAAAWLTDAGFTVVR